MGQAMGLRAFRAVKANGENGEVHVARFEFVPKLARMEWLPRCYSMHYLNRLIEGGDWARFIGEVVPHDQAAQITCETCLKWLNREVR